MKGEQVVSINYSLQLLIGSLDNDDELVVFTQCPGATSGTLGDDINRIDLNNRQASIKDIQNGAKWNNSFTGIHVRSISNAIDILNKSNKQKKWLIMLTDGEPEPGNNIESAGFQMIKPGTISIIYINPDKQNFNDQKRSCTYNSGNQLMPYILDHFPESTIAQTNQNSAQLLSSMVSVIKEIVGTDETLQEPEIEDNKIRIHSPVALNSLLVMFQGTTNLQKLLSNVTLNGEILQIQELIIEKKELNACLIRITREDTSSIYMEPGDYELNVTPGMEEHLDRISIYPDPIIEFSLNLNGKRIVEGSLIKTCLCNNDSIIYVKLFTYDRSGNRVILGDEELGTITCSLFPLTGNPNDLKHTDGAFIIKLGQDSLSHFSLKARLTGFFNRKSTYYSVIPDSCRQYNLMADEIVQFTSLGKWPLRPPEPIQIEVTPSVPGVSSSDVFKAISLNITHKGNLIRYTVDTLNGKWRINIIPEWGCPCFMSEFTDTLWIQGISDKICLEESPPKAILIRLTESTVFIRCLPLIKWILITLLTIIYLYGILSKKRFRKSARIFYRNVTQDDELYFSDDVQWKKAFLVNPGFLSWFKRWLIPFLPERRRLRIFKESLTFEAGKTSQAIVLPDKYLRKDMKYSGMPVRETARKGLRLMSGIELEIIKEQSSLVIKYVP